MTHKALRLLRPLMLRPLPVFVFLGAVVLGTAGVVGASVLRQQAAAAAIPIEWEQLIPASEKLADPRLLARGVVFHGGLDPNLKNSQPKGGDLVTRYSNRRVQIGGYMVPIDYDGTKVGIFLLVPYAGACIHVPPPPANQIIYVIAKEAFDLQSDQFTPVQVTGTLTVLETSTAFADVGYQMVAENVAAY